MPSPHLIHSYTCSARNAFNPSAALAATFIFSPSRNLLTSHVRRTAEVENRKRDENTPAYHKIDKVYHEPVRKYGAREGPDGLQTRHLGTPGVQEDASAVDHGPFARRSYRKSLQKPRHVEDWERRQRAIDRHVQAKDAMNTNPNRARRLNALNSNGQLEANFRVVESTDPLPNEPHWSSTLVIDGSNTQYRGDNWKHRQHILGRKAHEISKLKVSPHDTITIETRSKLLNYNAMYIDPPQSPLIIPQPIPWLVSEGEVAGKDGTKRLDMEIESFARWMACTPMETVARTALVDELTDLINRHAGSRVHVKTFGSQELGLATIMSDIDIRLSFTEGSSDPRMLFGRMRRIEEALAKHPDYILVSLRQAKYPILNAQHKHTGIDIQIVSSPDTKPQREAMSHYLQTIPSLHSTYLVLKTALGIRGLVDVFNGGIGSYGLFMMLAASLQRPYSDPPRSAAISLLRFLDFYSNLDMEKYAVSVAPPKLFKKHSVFTTDTRSHIHAARRRGDDIRAAQWAIAQKRIYQPYLFCLQDPANPFNDLGRKSNAIKHVQTTIRVFRNTLKKYLYECFPTVPSVVPWQDGSMLLPLVGRCHEIWKDRRLRAERQGELAVEAMRMRDVAQRLAEDEAQRQGVADVEEVKEEQKAAA